MTDVFGDLTAESGTPIDFSKILGLLKDSILGDMPLPFADLLKSLKSLQSSLDSGVFSSSIGSNLGSSPVSGLFGDSLLGATLGKYGDESAIELLNVADSYSRGMADKLTGALLSQMHMPEILFLTAIKAMKASGSDPNYNEHYLRSVALKKDLEDVLAWLDEINNITYVGGTSNTKLKDGYTAAGNSCVKIVRYILTILYNDIATLKKVTPKTDTDKKYLDDIQSKIRIDVYGITKKLIVNGYGNFTMADIVWIFEKFSLLPSVFGDTDPIYGGRFKITKAEVNKIAPIYKNKGGFMDDINQNEFIAARHEPTQYIVPRNKNIKRLYMYLFGDRRFGTNKIDNYDLHARLELKTMDTSREVFDEAANNLMENGIPGLLLDTLTMLHTGIYDFTKLNEPMLFDPSKVQYITFGTQEIIPPYTDEDSKSDADREKRSEYELSALLLLDDVINTKIPVTDIDINEFGATISLYVEKIKLTIINDAVRVFLGLIKSGIYDGNNIIIDRYTIAHSYYTIFKDMMYTPEFDRINFEQLFPLVVQMLRTDVYTREELSYMSVYKMISDLKQSKIDDASYEVKDLMPSQIVDYLSSINILKGYVDDYIYGVTDTLTTMPDATELLKLGLNETIPLDRNRVLDHAMYSVLANYINGYIRNKITKEDFPTVQVLRTEAEDLIANTSAPLGQFNLDDDGIKKLNTLVKDYINQLKNGIITEAQIPTQILLMDMLTVAGVTPDDKYKKLSIHLNKDNSYFDIDINDPKNYDSIESEIAISKGRNYTTPNIIFIQA